MIFFAQKYLKNGTIRFEYTEKKKICEDRETHTYF